MADKDKADQNEEVLDEKAGMKKNILVHLMKIRQTSDTFISLAEKNVWTADDCENAFEMNDGIQQESEEIISLLFDLRDALGFQAPR